MPGKCRCDCDGCESAVANGHCHLWPCRYANPAIQRIGGIPDPAHATTMWHNSVKGCVDCEWERLSRWCQENNVIAPARGPKDFTDKMIDYLKSVKGIA